MASAPAEGAPSLSAPATSAPAGEPEGSALGAAAPVRARTGTLLDQGVSVYANSRQMKLAHASRAVDE